jgi:hypothetical protein
VIEPRVSEDDCKKKEDLGIPGRHEYCFMGDTCIFCGLTASEAQIDRRVREAILTINYHMQGIGRPR